MLSREKAKASPRGLQPMQTTTKPKKNCPSMDRRRAPRAKWPGESPSRRMPEQTRSSGFASKEGGTKCECGWPGCVGWGSPSGDCVVTSGCVYSGDCTSIESGCRIGEYVRPVVDTRGALPPPTPKTNPSLNFFEKA